MEANKNENEKVNENDKKMLGNKRKSICEDALDADASTDVLACPEKEAAKKVFKIKKGRCFQFTLNAPDKELLAARYTAIKQYIRGLKNNNYFIAASEVGNKNKKLHIHMYMQFTVPVLLSAAKLCFAHVEVCKASPQQNKEYVLKNVPALCADKSKSNDSGVLLDELGVMHAAGGKTIADIRKMSPAERELLPACYYSVVEKINAAERNDIYDVRSIQKKGMQVCYYFGASGAGKSCACIDAVANLQFKLKAEGADYRMNWLKFEGAFWAGTGSPGVPIAVLDEFRDSQMPVAEFINFIDYNMHSMNIKGSNYRNEYRYIFISSITDPRDLYAGAVAKNNETIKQWMRRARFFEVLENPKDPEHGIQKELLYLPNDYSCPWKYKDKNNAADGAAKDAKKDEIDAFKVLIDSAKKKCDAEVAAIREEEKNKKVD